MKPRHATTLARQTRLTWQDAEISLPTEELTPEVAVNMIIDDLKGRGLIG